MLPPTVSTSFPNPRTVPQPVESAAMNAEERMRRMMRLIGVFMGLVACVFYIPNLGGLPGRRYGEKPYLIRDPGRRGLAGPPIPENPKTCLPVRAFVRSLRPVTP